MFKSNLRNKKMSAFTLLELLVVMAILAAVAGTASIALKDTDARAAAAAHVAMMDQLNKGIRSYRVLQKNELPTRFDGLLAVDLPTAPTTFTAPGMLGFTVDAAGTADALIAAIPTGVQQIMLDGGIDALMYVDATAQPDGYEAGVTDCQAANIQALINSRANAVVAGNIFLPAAANGCGTALPLDGSVANISGVYWIGGTTRLTGQDDPAGVGSDYDAPGNYVYLITGIGPASTLFDANTLGGMTTVPVYRHVGADEYGRFMAVWNVGTYGAAGAIVAGDQCELVAIVDGALDTKEEELGEWDGTRNTI